MKKRKLQVFVSSTYEDLIDERLTAIEAILAAGHIPAAMEQFSAGDDTALERIRRWIDESDGILFILGGRYGSIEPKSGKSYLHLEYEYAIEKKKPFFSLIVDEKHHEERVKTAGLKVHERENPEKYKDFIKTVREKLCGFWKDKKDIKAAIFQKLPEWASRIDLIGWIRGDEAASPQLANELARLSEENSKLRSKQENFEGLSFDYLVNDFNNYKISRLTDFDGKPIQNLGVFFEELAKNEKHEFPKLRSGGSFCENEFDKAIAKLISYNLISTITSHIMTGFRIGTHYVFTELGRHFRNRLLQYGDIDKRYRELWGVIDINNIGNPSDSSKH